MWILLVLILVAFPSSIFLFSRVMIPNFGYFVVSYFEMYGVELELWIKVASMHLEGATAHWFHSVERRLCHMGWNELCALVHDRFS
jgi:hypothetical protein